MHQKILSVKRIKNPYWKSRTLKEIIQIRLAKVWILEAIQETVCQDELLKMGFLQVTCHYLPERLNLMNKSSLLVNLYQISNIITRISRTIILFIHSMISWTMHLPPILQSLKLQKAT